MKIQVKFGERDQAGNLNRTGIMFWVIDSPIIALRQDGSESIEGTETLCMIFNEQGKIEFWDTRNVEMDHIG